MFNLHFFSMLTLLLIACAVPYVLAIHDGGKRKATDQEAKQKNSLPTACSGSSYAN